MAGPRAPARPLPATRPRGLTVVAGQLGGNLAWLALSAGGAPELLRSAPLPARSLERVTLAAALIPLAVHDCCSFLLDRIDPTPITALA
jgi:hypothetical protein